MEFKAKDIAALLKGVVDQAAAARAGPPMDCLELTL